METGLAVSVKEGSANDEPSTSSSSQATVRGDATAVVGLARLLGGELPAAAGSLLKGKLPEGR